MASPSIYFVDNDPLVRTAIKRLLLPLHVPVRSFGSAEQFLEEVDCGATGCLILDIELPDMSGIELLDHLNEQEWKLPVIFTTGYDEEWRETAMRKGAQDYLRKPYDCEQLICAVRKAMAANPALVTPT